MVEALRASPAGQATIDRSPSANQISVIRRPFFVIRDGKRFLIRSSCGGMTRLVSLPTALIIDSVAIRRLVWLPTANPIGT